MELRQLVYKADLSTTLVHEDMNGQQQWSKRQNHGVLPADKKIKNSSEKF